MIHKLAYLLQNYMKFLQIGFTFMKVKAGQYNQDFAVTSVKCI